MPIVDLHVSTSRRSPELNPDLRSLAATQAKRTVASDLRHCATRAGLELWLIYTLDCVQKYTTQGKLTQLLTHTLRLQTRKHRTVLKTKKEVKQITTGRWHVTIACQPD